jgi:hypothetical protein
MLELLAFSSSYSPRRANTCYCLSKYDQTQTNEQQHCVAPTPVTAQELAASLIRLYGVLLDSPEGYASDLPKVTHQFTVMAYHMFAACDCHRSCQYCVRLLLLLCL